MEFAYAACDLAVCRAGATTIAELTRVGRPAVLVPYPHAAADHQTLNARAVAEAGGALVFADAEIDGAPFAEAVIGLLEDAERRDGMARAAATLGRRDADERVAALATGAGVFREETR